MMKKTPGGRLTGLRSTNNRTTKIVPNAEVSWREVREIRSDVTGLNPIFFLAHGIAISYAAEHCQEQLFEALFFAKFYFFFEV